MFPPKDTGRSKGRACQCQRKAATLHLGKPNFSFFLSPSFFPWLHSNCIAAPTSQIPEQHLMVWSLDFQSLSS